MKKQKEKESAFANSQSLIHYRKRKQHCQSSEESEALERMTEEHRQEELERRAVEQIDSADFSECYPLGGMVEPYDIEREKELIRKHEKSKN